VYANDSYQKINPGFPDEADGGWTRPIHPTDLPGVVAALADSHRHGHDFDREFRFVRPDGRVCWVHCRTTPLRAETGEFTGDIGTVEDITGRKSAETELERVQQELIDASHKAGVAEFTTGVLHNVKNVINSINVSATVLSRMILDSKSSGLTRLSRLMREQGGDLGAFLTRDPKGKQVPAYLELLAAHLDTERKAVLEELRHLESDVQHVKEIVTMEQDFAKLGGTSEKVRPVELMADALRINAASLSRHGVQVASEQDPDLPEITVEKHKVLQILINFIRNAKDACNDSGRPERNVILRVRQDGSRVHFSVTDNGVGITPEARARIFAHGFTTKKQGHGFGLHSGARSAQDLGGALEVHSDGPGTGATFTLSLPLCPPAPVQPAADAAGPDQPAIAPSPTPCRHHSLT
jgi:PAS domain S-box-containing protein